MIKYKCPICFCIGNEPKCVECGYDSPSKMCEHDHLCTCIYEHSEGLRYCQKCGAPICPCGCHDVSQISRVTGYLADVSGMNNGKQQEIKDRQRYVLSGNEWKRRND